MHTEFRRVDPHEEMHDLLAFDREAFSASDCFDSGYWEDIESYWMLIDNIKVGCCAFEMNVDFKDDLSDDDANPPRNGSLFIASTAILPQFRGVGFGRMLKEWQICYARHHGFVRIVTNMRSSNAAIIGLNRKFGFKLLRTTPDYYFDPDDAVTVMELDLAGASLCASGPAA